MDEHLNFIDCREFFSEPKNGWLTCLNVFESGALGRVEVLVAASRQRNGGLAYLIDELLLGCFAENYAIRIDFPCQSISSTSLLICMFCPGDVP